MKWPNDGHQKAKEHSWLPASLFSPLVCLIACKRAASPSCVVSLLVPKESKTAELSHNVFSCLHALQLTLRYLTASICVAGCAHHLVWSVQFVTENPHWFLLHRRPYARFSSALSLHGTRWEGSLQTVAGIMVVATFLSTFSLMDVNIWREKYLRNHSHFIK